jgi:hypothetical protein
VSFSNNHLHDRQTCKCAVKSEKKVREADLWDIHLHAMVDAWPCPSAPVVFVTSRVQKMMQTTMLPWSTFLCTANLPRTVTVPSYALLAARLLLVSGQRVLSLTPVALQSSSTTTYMSGVWGVTKPQGPCNTCEAKRRSGDQRRRGECSRQSRDNSRTKIEGEDLMEMQKTHGEVGGGRVMHRAIADAIAGTLAGGVSRTIVSPLDVIKIRFQVRFLCEVLSCFDVSLRVFSVSQNSYWLCWFIFSHFEDPRVLNFLQHAGWGFLRLHDL